MIVNPDISTEDKERVGTLWKRVRMDIQEDIKGEEYAHHMGTALQEFQSAT